MIIGPGAVRQQQPGDGGVRRARDRAQQRRPLVALPVRAVSGIGAGVQQQPRDLGQPAGPGRVQPVPLRGARRVQGGPPGLVIRPGGQPRVTGQHLPDPGGVAQDDRGAEVVAGHPRVARQHPRRPPGPVTDAGDQELLHPLPQFGGTRPDLGHQLRPARVAVLAGDGQLSGGQCHRPGPGRGRVGGDPAQRGRIPGPGGIAQLLGPAAELVQAGPQRKRLRRHVISSPAPHGPHLGRREDDTGVTKDVLPRRTSSSADPGAPSTRTVMITPEPYRGVAADR